MCVGGSGVCLQCQQTLRPTLSLLLLLLPLCQYHVLPEAVTAKQLRNTSRVLSVNNQTVFLNTDKK